jgi:hypothetical protein
VSNEERARKEAGENRTSLSPDQEAREKKAASGFTNATEILIRNSNNEARLLCQEGIHMNSASARVAIEEIDGRWWTLSSGARSGRRWFSGSRTEGNRSYLTDFWIHTANLQQKRMTSFFIQKSILKGQ